jgi:hypothetical protein
VKLELMKARVGWAVRVSEGMVMGRAKSEVSERKVLNAVWSSAEALWRRDVSQCRGADKGFWAGRILGALDLLSQIALLSLLLARGTEGGFYMMDNCMRDFPSTGLQKT